MAGKDYTVYKRYREYVGKECASKRKFLKCSDYLWKTLAKLVDDDTKRAVINLQSKSNAVVTVDGAWSQRSNPQNGIIMVIDFHVKRDFSSNFFS